ncbi:MAG: isoprenylcysteine carboxylmethyltransferase family protein [Betaproteobacteria bacterium]|nr:isoprenylcysteine carboxylmethyltransferase family protein [Betaproteobacteria bacterium]
MHDPARRPATLMLPPLPYAAALYAGWRLEQDWLAAPLDLGRANPLLGWPLVTLGLALFAWTLLTFRRHRTTVNPYQAASHLCIDGPFQYTRNPIYLGDWLIFLGVTLLLHTAWPLAFAPLIWLLLRYGVIRHEEAHLEARFGDAYRRYRQRVGRWLGHSRTPG